MQRLESTIIHWTRQIKEVVNQQVSPSVPRTTCLVQALPHVE